MSANCQIALMVWAPKLARGTDGAGLARASERCLADSVAALVEKFLGMALLWENTLLFFLCDLPMSLAHICGSSGSGVSTCRCNTIPCHGSTKVASAVVSNG